MALTRKFLAALGIEQEKIDEIIEAHTETVNALKEERDNYKKDAEALPGVQKELDELKEAAEKNPDGVYKQQYDDLKSEYDQYKADVEAKETKAKKADAYRKLLKDASISEKCIESVLRVSDLNSIELDKDGAIKGADDLKKKVAEEWSAFVVKEENKGANTGNPPEGNGGGTGGRTPSRAAEVAKKYREALYGEQKGDNAT